MPYKSWEDLKKESLNYLNFGVGIFQVWKMQNEAGCFTFFTDFEDQPDKRFTQFSNRLINFSAIYRCQKRFFDPKRASVRFYKISIILMSSK